MIIRAIDAHLDGWIARRVTPPRSTGQHVSTIVTDMLKSLPVKRYEKWGRQSGDNERHPMHEAGYAWEDALAKVLAERPPNDAWLCKPIELALDGIYGTPDRILVELSDHGERIVDEEIKFTWMSCKPLLRDPNGRPTSTDDWTTDGLTDDPKFAYWLLQAKTYAAMLYLRNYRAMIGRPFGQHDDTKPMVAWIETNEGHMKDEPWPVTTPITRLRALFINGAYRDELAIPGAFEIEWTPEELTSWWANVKGHAEQMRMRESQTPDDPIF